MKILITGTRSGFGKYLFSEYDDCYSLDRYTDPIRYDIKRFDIIIHCAHDNSLEMNRRLINDLDMFVRAKRFIYMSSMPYPINNTIYSEDSKFDDSEIGTDFLREKKLLENFLLNSRFEEILIMRIGGLLGRYSRWNNMRKLIEQKSPDLTIHPDSRYYVMTHSAVKGIIDKSNSIGLCGIYNIAPREPVLAYRISEEVGNNPKWGEYLYLSPLVSSNKAFIVFPELQKTSIDFIREHLSDKA